MFRKALPLLLCLAVSSTLSAQVVRTWVSTTGSDLNPCSKPQPCRNFNAAIAAVDPEGEVVALDSGGYGAAVINKAVSVIAPAGLHAAIAPTAGSAVLVNAPGEVVLRNLYLNSQGATVGVEVQNGPKTYLEGLVVNGFNAGIFHDTGSTNERLFLHQVTSRNNNIGLEVASGAVTATGCIFEGNSGFGIDVRPGARVDVTESVISANSDIGVRVNGSLSESGVIVIHRSTISKNSVGLLASGTTTNQPGRLWVSDSLIADNFAGLHAAANSRVGIVGNRVTTNSNGVVSDAMATIETNGTTAVNGNVTDFALAGATAPITMY